MGTPSFMFLMSQFILLFFSLMAIPGAIILRGSSWANDWTLATAVTYAAAAAMPDPLTHCSGLGMEPVSWRCRDAANPVAPQQELLILFSSTVIYKRMSMPLGHWVSSQTFTSNLLKPSNSPRVPIDFHFIIAFYNSCWKPSFTEIRHLWKECSTI